MFYHWQNPRRAKLGQEGESLRDAKPTIFLGRLLVVTVPEGFGSFGMPAVWSSCHSAHLQSWALVLLWEVSTPGIGGF